MSSIFSALSWICPQAMKRSTLPSLSKSAKSQPHLTMLKPAAQAGLAPMSFEQPGNVVVKDRVLPLVVGDDQVQPAVVIVVRGGHAESERRAASPRRRR